MSGWRNPIASASSPPTEAPHTAVRSAGSSTPKRDCTHSRTSPTKNSSCAAKRCASNTGVYSWSRVLSPAPPWTPTIIVVAAYGGLRASHNRRTCHPPSAAKTTELGGAGGTYTVTWRPPSYANVSVTNCPVVGDIRMALRRERERRVRVGDEHDGVGEDAVLPA